MLLQDLLSQLLCWVLLASWSIPCIAAILWTSCYPPTSHTTIPPPHPVLPHLIPVLPLLWEGIWDPAKVALFSSLDQIPWTDAQGSILHTGDEKVSHLFTWPTVPPSPLQRTWLRELIERYLFEHDFCDPRSLNKVVWGTAQLILNNT